MQIFIKTFDGKTAGFLALIMNAISRDISEDRIEELMDPKKVFELRKLLLPLLDNRLTALVDSKPFGRFGQIISHPLSLSGKHTLRSILNEAYDRKYNLLNETQVFGLAEAFNSAIPWLRDMEENIFVPFKGHGDRKPQVKLLMFSQVNGSCLLIDDCTGKFDTVDKNFQGSTFLFLVGSDDRSSNFKLT